MTYLGTCRKGYTYYLAEDLYVYQFSPNGESIGWLCFWPVWERTFYRIVE